MEKRLTKEEFLKDLWHPASDKPNIKQGECCVTCLVKFKNADMVDFEIIEEKYKI